jgi:hypothetical protein
MAPCRTVCFGACPIVRKGHSTCVEKLVIVCGRAKIQLLNYPTINVITALKQQQQHVGSNHVVVIVESRRDIPYAMVI